MKGGEGDWKRKVGCRREGEIGGGRWDGGGRGGVSGERRGPELGE